MKGKTKRIISATLALTTLLSLSACKKENTKKSDSENSVRWLTAYSAPKDHNVVLEATNKLIKEKTGLTLDLTVIDTGAYGEKMNLMISSNEDYDVCFTSNWLNDYVSNVKKKAYLKLDDYIEKMPTLKNAVPDYVWETARTDGGIYAVPNLQIMASIITMNVKPDLVKKYNIDVNSIKEFKDLTPILETIKKNEPDLIPYKPSWTVIGTDYESFSGQIYLDRDGKEGAKAVYEIEEYREFLDLMHDWYKKGYIASDVLTTSGVSAEMYAVQPSNYSPGVEGNELSKYGWTYERSFITEPFVAATAGLGTMNAVNALSKNPENALKMIELLYTDKEVYNTLLFGIEGKHYEKVSDNVARKINDDYKFSSGWLFGNQFNAFITEGQAEDTWEVTEKLNNEAKKSNYLGFSFDISNVKNEIASVSAVQSEYENFLNYGVEDPAKHWDSYVQKLKNAGIEKIKAEFNRQLDEWKKTK